MRGKVQLRNGKQTSRGITPAYAGKRWTVAGTVAARWDHPRVCGEKASLMLASDAELGSPPRMRGKVREIKTGKSRRGITPAYAGKRRRCCAFRWLPWDHPRVCGEKSLSIGMFVTILGSPPRMRGKVGLIKADRDESGITPAYAGKSFVPVLAGTVHKGSPPRMRGKGWTAKACLKLLRITPAYAGKSEKGAGKWQ